MSDFLLDQAVAIRDEKQDSQNTALRIGKLFVDIVNALGQTLSAENISFRATDSGVSMEFCTKGSTEEARAFHIVIPLLSNTTAGMITPAQVDAIKKELNEAVAAEREVRSNADSALQNLTNLLHDKFDEIRKSAEKLGGELDSKQDKLVSGTNLKTINGRSLLGSGNIELDTRVEDKLIGSIGNRVFGFNGFVDGFSDFSEVKELAVADYSSIVFDSSAKKFAAISTSEIFPLYAVILSSSHGNYYTDSDTVIHSSNAENYEVAYSNTYGFVFTDGRTLYVNESSLGNIPEEYNFSGEVKYYACNGVYYKDAGHGLEETTVPNCYSYTFTLGNYITNLDYLPDSVSCRRFVDMNTDKVYVFEDGELVEFEEDKPHVKYIGYYTSMTAAYAAAADYSIYSDPEVMAIRYTTSNGGGAFIFQQISVTNNGRISTQYMFYEGTTRVSYMRAFDIANKTALHGWKAIHLYTDYIVEDNAVYGLTTPNTDMSHLYKKVKLFELPDTSELSEEVGTMKNKIDILYKVSLNLSGGKNVEMGTTQTVNLSWTVKVNGSAVDPSSQTLNGEVLDTTVRSKQFTGVTSDTTYTLVVDGVTATAHVRFYTPAYFGVVSADYVPDGSISGLTKLTNYGSKSYTGKTAAEGYNKVVYMYPASLGTLSSIKDGNNFDLTNSFTRSTITVNDTSYYVYVLTDATDTSSQTFKFT